MPLYNEPARYLSVTALTPASPAITTLQGNTAGITLIGGTSVTADLALQTTSGVGEAGADMHFLVGDNGATEAMTILNDGRVGIGMTNPEAQLEVRSTDGGTTNILFPLWLFHDSSETPAAGFGTGMLFTAKRSDGIEALMASISAVWTDATASAEDVDLIFTTTLNGGFGEKLRITSTGNVGIGIEGPAAVLHLKAGTAAASTAPLKFTSGTLQTAAEAGAVEFATDDFFATITTGSARKALILDDGARLSSGKIPVAGTNGRLIDGQTPLAGTKVYYVSDSSGGAVTRKLTFTNGILTAEV